MTGLDRRLFLLTLGAPVGAAALATLGCAGRTGAAASGGMSANGIPTSPRPLGLQLYTVRDAMKADVAGTLARVARIGYKEVEFAGYFGVEPRALRAILDANGLRAPASHIQTPIEGAPWQQTLAAAPILGHEWLVVPYLPEEARRSLDDFRRLAERLNRAGADAKRAGLRLAYHNHDFEFARMDGQLPYELLLAQTDPALVSFEMDLYWATKAGQDPIALMTSHPGRVTMVHVKDSSGPPEHQMRPVGEGVIDFPRILDVARRQGVQHFFVEHDNAADAFASIQTSFTNLSRIMARV